MIDHVARLLMYPIRHVYALLWRLGILETDEGGS